MARNSASQNPRNKVGRNSGAGEAGITEMVPTDREASRGLQPVRAPEGGRWGGRLAFGFGAIALLGAGAAAFVAQRARRTRGLRPRIERMVGLR